MRKKRGVNIMNSTRKIILCCVSILITGCSVKNSEQIPPEQVDLREENDNNESYMEINYKDITVLKDSVALDYDFKISSASIQKEYSLIAFQDGIPIPFALEEDGDYALEQRVKFNQKDNSSRVYLKTKNFEKEESLELGLGFVSNPDYIPELMEFTRYDITTQSVTFLCGNFKSDISMISQISAPNILKKQNWEDTGVTDENNMIESYKVHENKGVLENMIREKTANDVNVIYQKRGENLHVYFMMDEKASKGTLTFYLDHEPLKINDEYDAVDLSYHGKGFGITEFQLTIPDDIEKGSHTFYAAIYNNEGKEKKYNGFEITNQRVLEIE